MAPSVAESMIRPINSKSIQVNGISMIFTLF
jgi:hypothetical protein